RETFNCLLRELALAVHAFDDLQLNLLAVLPFIQRAQAGKPIEPAFIERLKRSPFGWRFISLEPMLKAAGKLVLHVVNSCIVKSKPLPSEFKLAPTLATRVFQLREFRSLTVKDLAQLARFTPERISDIEAGLETWLSVTDRQKLAKALIIDPVKLQ